MQDKLSHIDSGGRANMVDVSHKTAQTRTAKAAGALYCAASTLSLLQANNLPKGDVFAVARIAGIQAAKRCAELIPLCHQLPLKKVAVGFEPAEGHIKIEATASAHYQTGVEMEALTAVSVAALTLYDMLKAVDKDMHIDNIHLVSKHKA